MDVKSEYSFLVREIKQNARDVGRFNLAKYLGTSHILYNVSVPELRKIATSWTKANQNVGQGELESLLDALFGGKSREEKVLGAMILGRMPKLLPGHDEKHLDSWLTSLEGWEEVDSICDEIDVWLRADLNRVSLLKQWNKDKQIEKRRASLVVLCSSVRIDKSRLLRDTSFQFIDNLKAERHVMITKAISWLLRSLIKYHKEEVAAYLKKNSSTLPKIAVREVTRKLETGRK